MGYSSWSDEAYTSLRSKRKSKGDAEIFAGTSKIHPTMDPKGLKSRESRDSEEHPESTAIIVAFDVTGSMGHIPVQFAREKLGGLMRMLVERKYIAHPQLCFAAIGDAVSDRAPLQVGQFESGLEMDMWLTRIFLERGGGDAPESYTLAHWFAAHHTSVDCWEKRERKGYLFTIGDASPKATDPGQIERVFGYTPESASIPESIKAAMAEWEVFHVHVNDHRDGSIETWQRLLGDRLLALEHTAAVCELIGVTIGLGEGTIDGSQAVHDLMEAGIPHNAAIAIRDTAQVAAEAR